MRFIPSPETRLDVESQFNPHSVPGHWFGFASPVAPRRPGLTSSNEILGREVDVKHRVRVAETETDDALNCVMHHPRRRERHTAGSGKQEWGQSIQHAIGFGLGIPGIVIDAAFSTEELWRSLNPGRRSRLTPLRLPWATFGRRYAA